jgi:hypothetical protein
MNIDPNYPKSRYVPTGERVFSFGSAQKYTDIHLVWAVPMKLGDYNVLRGWNTTSNEDPEKNGYLVKILDTEPNMDGFSGTITWNSAEVFHASYTEGQIIRKTTHGERMLAELVDLTDKISKLTIFVKEDIFKALDAVEQCEMVEQLKAMREYVWFLGKRVARLSGQRK